MIVPKLWGRNTCIACPPRGRSWRLLKRLVMVFASAAAFLVIADGSFTSVISKPMTAAEDYTTDTSAEQRRQINVYRELHAVNRATMLSGQMLRVDRISDDTALQWADAVACGEE